MSHAYCGSLEPCQRIVIFVQLKLVNWTNIYIIENTNQLPIQMWIFITFVKLQIILVCCLIKAIINCEGVHTRICEVNGGNVCMTWQVWYVACHALYIYSMFHIFMPCFIYIWHVLYIYAMIYKFMQWFIYIYAMFYIIMKCITKL